MNFKKIDAFAKGQSFGNPAGCIYVGEEKLSPNEMQRIARELKGFVNEVVFVYPIKEDYKSCYSLLYYSAECEVKFCGHGTIACMYDLIMSNASLREKHAIDIRTPMGDLVVYNKITQTDAVYIQAPHPVFKSMKLSVKKINQELAGSQSVINVSYPLDLINAGLNTLIVPITTLSAATSLQPGIHSLRDFCMENDIDIITVLTLDVADSANKVRTRVFAPKYGYLEDPTTGSGNAAVGYYLLKNSLWDGSEISIEQGPSLESPNIVKLDTVFDDKNNRAVLFGGRAVVRITGTYLLQEDDDEKAI